MKYPIYFIGRLLIIAFYCVLGWMIVFFVPILIYIWTLRWEGFKAWYKNAWYGQDGCFWVSEKWDPAGPNTYTYYKTWKDFLFNRKLKQ